MNFCNSRLDSYLSLSTSTVAADNSEIGNFQSESAAVRRKGFSAEHFVKAPIDIFLRFQHPVNLACIVLETGNEKAGFEVWTPESSEVAFAGSAGTSHACRSIRNLSHGRLTACQKHTVMFFAGTQPRGPILGSYLPFPAHESAEVQRMQRQHCLSRTSCIALRIYFVAGPVSPRLKVLEVWAKPTEDWPVSKKVAAEGIYATLVDSSCASGGQNVCTVRPDPPARGDACGNGVPSRGIKRKADSDQSPRPHPACGHVLKEGPAEFYDGITCELMCNPVVLPSGNRVDITTMNRLAEGDMTWGREPVDPFTGVLLPAADKVVVNAGLKSRIDDFKMQRQFPGRKDRSGDPEVSSPPAPAVSYFDPALYGIS